MYIVEVHEDEIDFLHEHELPRSKRKNPRDYDLLPNEEGGETDEIQW